MKPRRRKSQKKNITSWIRLNISGILAPIFSARKNPIICCFSSGFPTEELKLRRQMMTRRRRRRLSWRFSKTKSCCRFSSNRKSHASNTFYSCSSRNSLKSSLRSSNSSSSSICVDCLLWDSSKRSRSSTTSGFSQIWFRDGLLFRTRWVCDDDDDDAGDDDSDDDGKWKIINDSCSEVPTKVTSSRDKGECQSIFTPSTHLDLDRSIFVALYFNPYTSVFSEICLYLNSIFCNLVTVCVLICHFPPNLRKCQNRLSALRESAYVDELRRCNSHQG